MSLDFTTGQSTSFFLGDYEVGLDSLNIMIDDHSEMLFKDIVGGRMIGLLGGAKKVRHFNMDVIDQQKKLF